MSEKSKIVALIVAGGTGSRLGGEVPKQYLPLQGKMILRHTVEAFLQHVDIAEVRVVIHPEHQALYQQAVDGLELPDPVIGGNTRQASVYAGLKAIKADKVLIHDAARPFVSKALIDRVIETLQTHDAVIPGVAVTDTVKKLRGTTVAETLDRRLLVTVQTPQGFDYQTILDLHQRAEGMEFTDDAGLCEDFGIEVQVCVGEAANRKITTQEDYMQANRQNTGDLQVGTGYDVHAFEEGKDHVMLCGIKVPHDRGLKGHSDADVGLHALVDALLGAMAEGDIGDHFPPSDSKWKDADSSQFVTHALGLLKEKQGSIVNVDITLICEAPKIKPHRQAMREKVAALLESEMDQVSIKATTTEGLGFTGRQEGMAAQVVVMVIL